MRAAFVTAPDGRRLHYCTSGSGPVTVFFEAGLGKARTTWAGVQPAVARFATTVVYDRAGLGKSDPVGGPRRAESMVADHKLVRDATVHQSSVLVGHSYGGLICRSGAFQQPANVAGIVLVDEVSELCDELVYGNGMRGSGPFYRGRLTLARVGLLAAFSTRLHRRLLASGQDIDADQVTAAIAAVRQEDATASRANAALMEWLGFTSSLRRLRETGPWVPTCPLTSISSNRVPAERLNEDFIYRSHKAIVDLAPAGRHIFASTRSHHVQLVDPATVIDEIRRQVSAITG